MDKNRNNQNSGGTNIFASRQLGPFLLMGLLLTSMGVCFLILKPYIYPIILAAVFAMIFYPAYQFILKKTKNKPNLSAGISCALISLFVIVPIFIFVSLLVVKATSTYSSISQWIDDGNLKKQLYEFGLADPPDSKLEDSEKSESPCINTNTNTNTAPKINSEVLKSKTDNDSKLTEAVKKSSESELNWKRKVGQFILEFRKKVLQDSDKAEFEKNIVKFSQKALSVIAPAALKQAKKGIGFVISFFLMIFVLFYFFRDGNTIFRYILEISPLKKEHEKLLIDRVKTVIRCAVLGTFLTAVAQGVLGMIIFAFTGIPWFFWGVMMGFASLIPVVGTALVWFPCCIYLAIIGNFWQAGILAVYSIVIIGSADNFLRPYFMKGNTGMSSIIAFFAILGGIEFFGLIGVVFGPLIFGICAMLLYIFKLEVADANPQSTPKKKRKKQRKPKTKVEN